MSPVATSWPPGSPRVLVADAWLPNAGDGAIALRTDARIRHACAPASVLHAAHHGDLLEQHYPELAIVPPLPALLGVTPESPELGSWDGDGAELIEGADVVVSQGGGFLMEAYRPWARLRAYELVRERGLPIGFGPQSIGVFRAARERAMLRRAFGYARVIAVRDSASARNVIEIGGSEDKIVRTADEAFDLPAPRAAPLAERRGILLALSGHRNLERGLGSADETAEIAAVFERLLDDIDEPITLASTTQGLGSAKRGLEDDLEYAERVVAHSSRLGSRTSAVRGYLAPRRFMEAIASHRAVVSMRMHPVVFSALVGTPALLLHSSPRTSMLGELSLGDLVGPSLEATGAARDAILRLLEPDPERDARVAGAVGAATDRAAGNVNVVSRILATARTAAAGVGA